MLSSLVRRNRQPCSTETYLSATVLRALHLLSSGFLENRPISVDVSLYQCVNSVDAVYLLFYAGCFHVVSPL